MAYIWPKEILLLLCSPKRDSSYSSLRTESSNSSEHLGCCCMLSGRLKFDLKTLGKAAGDIPSSYQYLPA